MPIEVAGVVARLGFRVDDDGANRFERKVRDLRSDAKRDVVVPLKGDLQARDLDLYDKKLHEIRAKVRRREDFKAQLGADFDPRAFNAYERENRRMIRTTDDNVRAQGRLRGSLKSLAGGAAMGGVAAAGVGIGLAFTKTISLAADFQEQMSRLGAVSDASRGQLKALEKQAMSAGAATKFSALDAAAAQTELVKGGLALEDVLSGGLDAALSVAASGEMGLADAASTTVNAMKLFKIEGGDAVHVADALATAANSTTADVSDFALALQQGGSAARAAGYDLDQTVVALELLAENGIKGSDAGTSLKAMFTQLAAPTKDQAALMDKLNLSFFDQHGNMKSVADISVMLRDRMKGMTKEQELQTVKTIAGTDGMRAMLAMFDAGPDKVEKLRKGLEKHGTAADVAAKKQDNFKGKLENFQGSLETMAIGIGTKILPSLEKAVEWLTKFTNQMSSGKGDGGRFVKRLEEIWDRLVKVYKALAAANRWLEDFYTKVGRGAKRTADDLLGMASTILGVFADIAEGGAKLGIPGMKGIAKDLRGLQSELDKTREGLRDTADAANDIDMSKVRKENRQTARAFEDMSKDGKVSVRDIAAVVRRRSNDIRKDLGGNSREGKEALRDNFREAMDAVHRQMRRGTITTRDGMKAIRGYLADELRVYGLSISEGQKLSGTHPFAKGGGPNALQDSGGGGLGGNPLKAPSVGGFRAGGGWIGAPGSVGVDSVPAMLAPGEAVLNRHQQAVIEGMLGGGFLDQLFARVQTPHYMARGGIVPVPGFPTESAASSVIPKILQIARQFGLTLTDAFGSGHKSPGHTQFGTAADFSGPDAAMDRAVQALVRAGYLVGYDGRFGSQAWPGHGPTAVAGNNAHLHVELGGKGGSIAGALAQIAGVAVKGGGAVGAVAQGALNMARAGAQAFYENAANSMLATPVGGGGTGGGNAGNRRLGRSMLGMFGFGGGQFPALDRLWTGESGWNERADNPNSDAYGIPQALPGSKMASAGADWQTNPATQIKWGLGYIKERYGSPSGALSAWLSRKPHWYKRGGRVRGGVQYFQGGGRPIASTSRARPNTDFHSGVSEESHAAPQGFSLRSVRRTLSHRIGDYENYMTAVDRTRSRYSIAERLYNRIDEGSLVDEKTGAVNVEAVQEKAARIWDMIVLAGQIVHYLEQAQKVARRVVNSYKTIVDRLRTSLRHAKKKDRAGIRSQLSDAIAGRDEYQGIVGDLGFDVKNARMDWQDLGAERDAILATSGTPPEEAAADAADTGPTQDQQAITDRIIADAAATTANLAATRASFSAFTSSGDIGSARGSSAFGSTLVDAVGGVGGLGAAGVPGAFGGTTVIINSSSLVPGTQDENLRISDAVVTALGTRPARPLTQATVGG